MEIVPLLIIISHYAPAIRSVAIPNFRTIHGDSAFFFWLLYPTTHPRSAPGQYLILGPSMYLILLLRPNDFSAIWPFDYLTFDHLTIRPFDFRPFRAFDHLTSTKCLSTTWLSTSCPHPLIWLGCPNSPKIAIFRIFGEHSFHVEDRGSNPKYKMFISIRQKFWSK